MPLNTGSNSSFPRNVDLLYAKRNAFYSPSTDILDGDYIESSYKNSLDDAVYAVEAELQGAPVMFGSTSDMRISAVTRMLKAVRKDEQYIFTLPETITDFLGMGSLGYQWDIPSVYLLAVRPYYAEYDDPSKIPVIKAMWTNLEALIQGVALSDQFVWYVDSSNKRNIIVKFHPATGVTASAPWGAVYDGAVGHAGNFIVSLIIATSPVYAAT